MGSIEIRRARILAACLFMGRHNQTFAILQLILRLNTIEGQRLTLARQRFLKGSSDFAEPNRLQSRFPPDPAVC
jgi:hypothetical protein